MTELRYKKDSIIVQDESGRRARINLTIPLEAFTSVNGNVGQFHHLPLLSMDGHHVRRMSDGEFKDLYGVVWKGVETTSRGS